MQGLCRDCLCWDADSEPAGRRSKRCPDCGSARWISHSELADLTIAHLDCDAFYATVKKRDRPDLRNKPVIVGGSKRGVVSAACYVARLYGVRSAMPMFKALRACPDAVVIKPDMKKYAAVGREVRTLMRNLTPQVEPLSIDEAFMDLSDCQQSHGVPPALALTALVKQIETDLGITASIGLSYNKFLAKLASDLDKPRGFAAIGKAEAVAFLAPRPVGNLWGVGRALRERLERDGLATIGDVAQTSERWLTGRYGKIGHRLWAFSHGRDDRRVTPDSPTRSVSSETTFDTDSSDPAFLHETMAHLADRVAERLRSADLAAATVVVKAKTAAFRTMTRSHTLAVPTQRADRLIATAAPLLDGILDAGPFRLIGVGAGEVVGAETADPPDLLDADDARNRALDRAIADVRSRFGAAGIKRGEDA